MQKDKSKLLPFDLEKAKAGEPICWSALDHEVEFVGMLGRSDETLVVRTHEGTLEACSSFSFRMAPLFWLEGKPVYKGDVLYSKVCRDASGEPLTYIVDSLVRNVVRAYQGSTGVAESTDNLTWNKHLFALEGRPVFEGDTVYSRDGDEVVVKDYDGRIVYTTPGQVKGETKWTIDYLSWTKPKKSGWLNIYPSNHCWLWSSQKEANEEAGINREACIFIEY